MIKDDCPFVDNYVPHLVVKGIVLAYMKYIEEKSELAITHGSHRGSDDRSGRGGHRHHSTLRRLRRRPFYARSFDARTANPSNLWSAGSSWATSSKGSKIIDQVTIGCEGPDVFAIHCHGNPLIVERIMELLRRHGVQPVRAEQLLASVLESQKPQDAIAVEAKLALTTVKTTRGRASSPIR